MANLVSVKFGSGDRNRISYGRPAGDGYKYVLKHGLGPGTIPANTGIIKAEHWDNGITFAWLDRVLTLEENKKFDIPLETENDRYERLCQGE